MKVLKIITLLGCIFAMTGCDPYRQNEDVGTVTGAVAGGLLGSTIGGGAGRGVAIGAGALVGGMVGNSVGRSMDEQQHAAYYNGYNPDRYYYPRGYYGPRYYPDESDEYYEGY